MVVCGGCWATCGLAGPGREFVGFWLVLVRCESVAGLDLFTIWFRAGFGFRFRF